MFAVALSNLFRLRWWLPPLAVALALAAQAVWLPALIALAPALARVLPAFETLAPLALNALYALVPLTLLSALWPWRPVASVRSGQLAHLPLEALQDELAQTFRVHRHAAHVRSLEVEGADLLLMRDGERILVQCRHWHRRRIETDPLRALCGVISREKADGALFLTRGKLSVEAMRFLRDVPIVLVDERTLENLFKAGPDCLKLTPAALARRALASTAV